MNGVGTVKSHPPRYLQFGSPDYRTPLAQPSRSKISTKGSYCRRMSSIAINATGNDATGNEF